MPEYNDKNIARLAEEVTDSVDMDALRQHFYEDQYDYFKNDKEAFLTDGFDMLTDEEQLRVFENEGGSTYSKQMQDLLEPIEEDEDEH